MANDGLDIHERKIWTMTDDVVGVQKKELASN